MNYRKPILITGSHRSGTTWVGNILSMSPSLYYIAEPFNPTFGKYKDYFNYWFLYISSRNETAFQPIVAETIYSQYNILNNIQQINNLGEIPKVLKEYALFLSRNTTSKRPVVKDPIALFSAEWLVEEFNMNILVLIRHPAAFAGSLKRMNWTFDFANFLKQPLLMEKYLYPFEAEIRKHIEQEQDIIKQASLLWKIIHYVIAQYREKYSEWLFMRHEDISREPLKNFAHMFEQFNVCLSSEIKQKIEEHSYGNSNISTGTKAHILVRDSKSNIFEWKNRLTTAEIKEIRTEVEEISSMFYSEEDW